MPYDLCWRVTEPVSAILGAMAVLRLPKAPRSPLYATTALILHGWALGYPERWPENLLEFEIHLVAFTHLFLGLFLIAGPRNRSTIPLVALFLGQAVGFYSAPWHMDVRVVIMWWMAACFVGMSLPWTRSALLQLSSGTHSKRIS